MKHKIFLTLLPPILTGSLIFIIFNRQIVSALTDEQIVDYNQVELIIERNEKGIGQLKAVQGKKVLFRTDDNFNHTNLIRSGNMVAWTSQIDSQWQIFIAHLPSGNEFQLTYTENNVNPKMSEQFIAWEKQIEGIWHIMLFDGRQLTQVTSDPIPHQLIALDDNVLIYQGKTADEAGWELFSYDLQTLEEKNLNPGLYSGDIQLANDKISWCATDTQNKKFDNFYDIKSGEMFSIEVTTASPGRPESTTQQEVNKKIMEKQEIKRLSVEDIKAELDLLPQDVPESSQSESSAEEGSAESDEEITTPEEEENQDIPQDLPDTVTKEVEETTPSMQ